MWGFLVFLSPGIYGHCRSKRLPITKEPKRKRADRRKKGKEDRKRLGGCIGVQYFLLRDQSWVNFSTNRALIHRSPGVKYKLLHCVMWIFCGYFPSFCLLYCNLVSSDKDGKDISSMKTTSLSV